MSNLNRIPPQSLETEQATLGSMLIEGRAIETAAEILQSEDFYRDAHKVIFEAILALVDRNEKVDILTLQEQLKSEEVLEKVGGTPYLVQLMNSVAAAANVEYYARIVLDKSKRRKLIDAGTQAIAAAYVEDEPFTTAEEKADRALTLATENRGKSATCEEIGVFADTAVQNILSLRSRGRARSGFSSGLEDIDYMTGGWNPTDLIIIAGRPSMGKTAIVVQMSQHMSRTYGPGLFVSLEMSGEQLAQRMLSRMARVDLAQMRNGALREDDMERVENARAELNRIKLHIEASPSASIQDIARLTRQKVRRDGIQFLVVDYLQRISRSGFGREVKPFEIVGEQAQALKTLAGESKIPVICLSQLNRECEKRPDKRPMLSDLADSGKTEAEADVVAFLYRPAYYKSKKSESEKETDAFAATVENDAEFIIAKQRNGPTGKVPLAFEPEFAEFCTVAWER